MPYDSQFNPSITPQIQLEQRNVYYERVKSRVEQGKKDLEEDANELNVDENIIKRAAIILSLIEEQPDSIDYTIFIDITHDSEIQFQVFNDNNNRKISIYVRSESIIYIKIPSSDIDEMEDGYIENERDIVKIWTWLLNFKEEGLNGVR